MLSASRGCFLSLSRGLVTLGEATPLTVVRSCSDLGAGTFGANLGPAALEIAALNARSDFFHRHPTREVETEQSAHQRPRTSFARNASAVLAQCNRLAEAVAEVAGSGRFPLVLSGDHSAGLGTIAGLRRADPEQRLGVLWIDAHADIHSPHSSPSGNLHGMPLAAALGWDLKGRARRELDAESSRVWSAMKELGGEAASPMIQASELLYAGVRDYEEEEIHRMRGAGIRNLCVDEVRSKGPEEALSEALEALSPCPHLYISFDVDAMDCDSVSRGTGTPVPHGFSRDECRRLISAAVGTGRVVCLELTEINPCLDEAANSMAEAAFSHPHRSPSL